MRFPAAIGLLAAAATLATVAAPTRTLTSPAAELQRGSAEGIGVTTRGRLFLAPSIARTAGTLPTGPAHVWAMTADRGGALYLGTGPDGKIVRVGAGGDASVFFSTDEPMVTALVFAPGGDLLAGTAPEGKIYRIRPDGSGSVWVDLDERYIWALAVDSNGRVLAGTGEKGLVVAIDGGGRESIVFDSDDAHVVSLEPLPDGAVLACGAGRGLVYRLDVSGRTAVLHDDDLPEARAVVREADGDIVAAFAAPPEPERRRPAVRIQVAGGRQPGPTGDGVSELDERPSAMLEGVIEGLPDGGDETGQRVRGRVVRIAPDGAVTELWRSATEAPYALALGADGRAVFGTGEPAKVYRVEDDDVALLASLAEGQVSALVRGTRSVSVATSNPGAVYRLDREPAESGSFVARPLDAGGSSDWGILRWRVDGSPGRVEFATRTGNSAEPDATWSEWSTPGMDAEGSAIRSPRGRFLQWRIRIFGGGPGSVTAPTSSAMAENRSPALRDLRLDPPGPWTAGRVGFRWLANDPDGDPLAFEVRYRVAGAADWITGARNEPPQPKQGDAGTDPDGAWKDGKLVWDTTGVPEGAYEVRVVASDRAANPSGEGKDATLDLGSLITVDRTAPSIEARRATDGAVAVTALDALSPIARLEVVAEGHALFAPRPEDRVCDAPRESFRLSRDEAGDPGSRVLRVVDAAGNVAETPVPTP